MVEKLFKLKRVNEEVIVKIQGTSMAIANVVQSMRASGYDLVGPHWG